MRFPPPLRQTVPALLVAGLLPAIGTIAAIVRLESLRDFEDREGALLAAEGNALSAYVQRDLARGDTRGLAHKVALTVATPNVRRVVVFDDGDAVLAAAGAPTVDGPLHGLAPADLATGIARVRATNVGETGLSPDEGSLLGLFPFPVPGGPGELRPQGRGVVLIEVDLSPQRLAASQRAWRRTALGAVAAGVIGGGVWLLLHLVVTVRARRLVEASRAIAGGDLTARAQVSGSDELAEIASAFNTMAESVRSVSEELRRAERELRVVVDNMPAGIVHLGADGRVTYVNPGTEALLGASAAAIVGAPWAAVTQVEALDGGALGSPGPALRALRTGEVVPATDYALRIGARRIPVRGQAAPVLDDGSAVVGSVEALVDITRLLEVEVERARSQERLARSQRLEALGTLAGGIAHDFNNILTAVLANIELARNAHPPPPVAGPLDEIAAGGLRARDLVRQILLFARPSGHERVPLALSDVVREAIGLLRATLPATVELHLVLADDTPPVLANASQMHQVVVNLATNAAHAMNGAGRLDVVLERSGGAVSSLSGVWARLSVRDTGVGIPPELLGRVFEPFFSTKPAAEGTGLGLAVVHGIVHAHGGTITVASTLGLGARFDVYLPAFDGVSKPAVPALVRPTPVVSGFRVVLVDDELAVLRVVTRLLENDGLVITPFHDPEAALRFCLASPDAFDLLVTDLTMPRLDGRRLARSVRALRPDVPIVLMSGNDRGDGNAAADLVLILLEKPFTAAEVRGAVGAALRGVVAVGRPP